ncbi:MAG: NADH-quinone oxidoreductase subunit J [Acidobacteria bacterium]|nr:NADH-quinone oxidoreductase subunit J [Acidobacteriota bacterium]
MELAPAAQIFAFAVLAIIAVAGALGMATTMSMFRSGIFLMASFIGVAGLFILLMADLLGMLQIMMYIGGMLVMILFMVLFSDDPGGQMMVGMMKRGTMKMSRIEMLFSRGISPDRGSENMGGEGHMEHGEMSGMSMFTPIKKQAAVLALLAAALLIGLILARPAWPVVDRLPDQNSPGQIGTLLMGKYMIAFEGAGLLILLGIFASVMISRPAEYPDPSDRERLQAAVAENPAPVEPDTIQPILELEPREEDKA